MIRRNTLSTSLASTCKLLSTISIGVSENDKINRLLIEKRCLALGVRNGLDEKYSSVRYSIMREKETIGLQSICIL